MNSISSFFEMGGYAAFVWPGFGLSAVVLVAVAVFSVCTLKRARATLKKLEAERSDAS